MEMSQALKFARSLLFRRNPVYVHYALTDRCNLRCRPCSIWKRQDQIRELPLADIADLADVIKNLGTIAVSLGGGEPAMREDLPEIVRIFLDRKLRTRVLTNGVAMTPDVAKSLLETGIREISFSLDSLRPDVQEDYDGISGTFETRIKNLVALAELMPKSGALPTLNTVVTPRNFRELPDILELGERIGFYVSFIPVHLAVSGDDDHRFYENDDALHFLSENETELQDVFCRLIAAKRSGKNILSSTPFLKRTADYLLTGKADWPCKAGRLYLSVGPDGMVSPCHDFEGQWETDFREFEKRYHSPRYESELDQHLAGCSSCFRPCWAEISYLMTTASGLLDMTRLQLRTARKRPSIKSDEILDWVFNRERGAL